MSNDLVKKLTSLAETAERSGAFTDEHRWILSDGVAEIAYEAADRIEALEKALRDIDTVCKQADDMGIGWFMGVHKIARAALEKKDD